MRHLNQTPHGSRREALLALRARELRGGLNAPQEVLWRAVAAGRLGVYFRREVVLLGRFIVDMLAPSIRLVVEVDGRCHERRRGADARRDKALARAGYRVLRVEARVVLRDLPVAVARVREAVDGFGRTCLEVVEYSTRAMTLTIELEQENDGRWIAEVTQLPGVSVYGETQERAAQLARALAFRVLADRLEAGEVDANSVSKVSFVAYG